MMLSQVVNIGGYNIRFDIKGSGRPLLVMHGTPWSSFNMRHIINHLSKNPSKSTISIGLAMDSQTKIARMSLSRHKQKYFDS